MSADLFFLLQDLVVLGETATNLGETPPTRVNITNIDVSPISAVEKRASVSQKCIRASKTQYNFLRRTDWMQKCTSCRKKTLY